MVTGCWVRDYLRWPLAKRLELAGRSLRTSARAFLHAGMRRCWGGVVVALGELSRALALVGLLHREGAVPQDSRALAGATQQRMSR